ncbi:MAG TPA: hypothetical protein VK453_04730 [Micromonosporaceae bacterium]|nr:hypothetical protein [Micromonosporaceae bacterium]
MPITDRASPSDETSEASSGDTDCCWAASTVAFTNTALISAAPADRAAASASASAYLVRTCSTAATSICDAFTKPARLVVTDTNASWYFNRAATTSRLAVNRPPNAAPALNTEKAQSAPGANTADVTALTSPEN